MRIAHIAWIAAAWLVRAAAADAQAVDPPAGAAEESPADEAGGERAAEEEAAAEDPSLEALSAEDLAAIEAATGADAEALAESGATGDAPGDGHGVAGGLAGLVQSMNPDLSVVADFALAWFSDDDAALQTGGHDPLGNGFTLQQLELSLSAAVDPYFRFDANLVFSPFGVEIEEAYATTLDLPALLQVRLGQFLTRFGRLNATHPHGWHFVDQPFALGRVLGGEGNRGMGVEMSWLSPLPWYVELVASATDAAGEATARSFYGPNDLGIDTPLDLEYVTALKQFFPLSEDWSLFWGLSAAFGPNGTGRDNRSEVYGTDLYLKWRPISRQSVQEVQVQSEWLYRRRQVPDDLLQDVSGYAYVFWRFERRWGAAARYEYGSPAWDPDFRRTSDYLDPDWTGHRHRASANLTFWPTEFSRLRVQGSVDLPEWLDEPIWAAFLQVELVTGAHGAHQF